MKILGLGTYVLLIFGAVIGTSPARADPRWCEGKIDNMLVDSAGNVLVLPTFRGDWIQICNVGINFGDVTPEMCKSWQALAMSAILADKYVYIYYGNAPTCGTLPTYGSAPAPGYFMLRKQQ